MLIYLFNTHIAVTRKVELTAYLQNSTGMINTSYRLEEILSKQEIYAKKSNILSLVAYLANKCIFNGQKIDLRPYTVSLLLFFIPASPPQRKPCRW